MGSKLRTVTHHAHNAWIALFGSALWRKKSPRERAFSGVMPMPLLRCGDNHDGIAGIAASALSTGFTGCAGVASVASVAGCAGIASCAGVTGRAGGALFGLRA